MCVCLTLSGSQKTKQRQGKGKATPTLARVGGRGVGWVGWTGGPRRLAASPPRRLAVQLQPPTPTPSAGWRPAQRSWAAASTWRYPSASVCEVASAPLHRACGHTACVDWGLLRPCCHDTSTLPVVGGAVRCADPANSPRIVAHHGRGWRYVRVVARVVGVRPFVGVPLVRRGPHLEHAACAPHDKGWPGAARRARCALRVPRPSFVVSVDATSGREHELGAGQGGAHKRGFTGRDDRREGTQNHGLRVRTMAHTRMHTRGRAAEQPQQQAPRTRPPPASGL